MKEKKFSPKDRLIAFLKMSRFSNLPTVWSNCLIGIVFAGTCESYPLYFLCLSALSCYYIAGMFLNDAFDKNWDEQNRPERPIPQGIIAQETAFIAGWGMLFFANLLSICGNMLYGTFSYAFFFYIAALSASIFLYNRFHKKNIYSPVLMAFCRFMIYPVSASMLQGKASDSICFPALMLASYILGISYLARQETCSRILYRWPLFFLFLPPIYILLSLPMLSPSILFCLIFLGYTLYCSQGIIRRQGKIAFYIDCMIAGISLWDALLLHTLGANISALLAIACFSLTIASHRFVSGT